MIEGIYGSIIFGRALGRIHTFSDLNRKYSGRYSEHDVHLRPPLLEFAGSDLVEIEMNFSLNASWCGNPNLLLAQWHLYEDNALAAPLIIGGKPMGPKLSLFVITTLDERHKYWLPGGKLIAVELTANFKEYVPFANDSLPATPLAGLLGFAGFGGGG